MDYETFITSLFQLLKSSENLYFVCYALLTCLFTQIAKKLFVSKVKVDVLHKFDLAVVLPFVFGGMFAVLDMVVIKHVRPVTFTVVLQMAVSTATIGALASVMFKLISSLGGKNLHTLLKDDVFGIFYTQLLYYGTIRESLVNKQLSMADFISQVKLLSQNAQAIFQGEGTSSEKYIALCRLLQGVVDDTSIDACAKTIAIAMESKTSICGKK